MEIAELVELTDKEFWDLIKPRRNRYKPTFVKEIKPGTILMSKGVRRRSEKEKNDDMFNYFKRSKFFK